jgi:hypothetical protein
MALSVKVYNAVEKLVPISMYQGYRGGQRLVNEYNG